MSAYVVVVSVLWALIAAINSATHGVLAGSMILFAYIGGFITGRTTERGERP